jgi:hypothetical protein
MHRNRNDLRKPPAPPSVRLIESGGIITRPLQAPPLRAQYRPPGPQASEQRIVTVHHHAVHVPDSSPSTPATAPPSDASAPTTSAPPPAPTGPSTATGYEYELLPSPPPPRIPACNPLATAPCSSTSTPPSSYHIAFAVAKPDRRPPAPRTRTSRRRSPPCQQARVRPLTLTGTPDASWRSPRSVVIRIRRREHHVPSNAFQHSSYVTPAQCPLVIDRHQPSTHRRTHQRLRHVHRREQHRTRRIRHVTVE